MTVTYTAEVATCRGFGCFLKLLLRWRGSIYKLVWLDLVAFLSAYYILSIIYRLLLNEQQKIVFVGLVKYCGASTNLIPLSFVLGFYVSIVMTRWWNQYITIPWPDSIAVLVSANIHGQDERGRVIRRTVMRYVCLCLTMVLTMISPRVKKRFPTLEHLVEAGLLTDNERVIMADLNMRFPRHSKHWMPIVWAASIVTRARKEGLIRDDFAVKTVIDELNKFRGQCGTLTSYDNISVPLVYTQVVTLAVYSYFIASIMASQWYEDKLVGEGHLNKIDLYFPVFSTLQFFFYMGWLKVAESLINPFGEDDDDFEVNWMVDRNLQVSYMIVDEMHHEHPELMKDQYWDEVFPVELPYTVGAEGFREEHPQPSTANIEIPKAAAEVIPVVPSKAKMDEMVGKNTQSISYRFPDQIDSEIFDDNASGIHFTAGRRNDPRHGSATSVHSVMGGSMKRVDTVASALKRFFSKDDARSNQSVEAGASTRLPASPSGTSLSGSQKVIPMGPVGSVRITDQVIEEVDEQLTITSMKGQPEVRPTAASLFATGPPTPSAPVDVPRSGVQPYTRTQSAVAHGDRDMALGVVNLDDILSTSAPTGQYHRPTTPPGLDEFDKKRSESKESAVSQASDKNPENPTDDEFEKLRLAREKERQERKKQLIARSISSTHQEGVAMMDVDAMLEQIVAQQTSTDRQEPHH
ncbi:bestrophin-4-like isoform X1 [Lutzomyia longipalpis]|uniref:bestrophin-4-like isoform X1 n=1 Tax=Lutzomyia longipalpis TaxID=7200 RepID=UPI0024835326|nr:bestrophin-4-like isoform X1 [Lutzomyia longipalpis]